VARHGRHAVASATAAFAAFLALGAAAGSPARRAPITYLDSGKSFALARGGEATLRLSGRWAWSYPRVSSRSVELVPVEYFRDPGFSEWIVPTARGSATIRSATKPGCTGCTLRARTFVVTIVVR
jgi:hypothetical protein